MSNDLRLNRAPIIATLVIFAGLVIASVVAYPSLPERIPQHFGIDGEVDRWVATSFIAWMLLPIVAAAVTGLVYGIAAIIPRDISKLNLPNKERLLRQPIEQQRIVIITIRNAMHWMGACVMAALSLIQLEVYTVARNGSAPVAVTVMIVVLLALVLVIALLMTRRLSKQSMGR